MEPTFTFQRKGFITPFHITDEKVKLYHLLRFIKIKQDKFREATAYHVLAIAKATCNQITAEELAKISADIHAKTKQEVIDLVDLNRATIQYLN